MFSNLLSPLHAAAPRAQSNLNERQIFVEAARVIPIGHTEGGTTTVLKPAQLLIPRRYDGRGDDLWTTASDVRASSTTTPNTRCFSTSVFARAPVPNALLCVAEFVSEAALGAEAYKFATLEDVRLAWQQMDAPRRYRREIISGLNSFERHTGRALSDIPLCRTELLKVIKTVNPIARGIAAQTWSSIRSRVNKAITTCLRGDPASSSKFWSQSEAAWDGFLCCLISKAERIVLSPLINWGREEGILPIQIDDATIEHFYAAGNWCARIDYDRYRRRRLQVWNALQDRCPQLGLRRLSVPAVRYRRTRIRWQNFHPHLRAQTDDHCRWAADANPFRPNARPKPLSYGSIINRRSHIHAAADALVRSGTPIGDLKSIADLLEPERVQRIFATRFEDAGNKHTWHNFHMGRTVAELATWSQLPSDSITKIRAITLLNKRPPLRMTEKNERIVLPFEDPELVARLTRLPSMLLAKAHLAGGSKKSRLAVAHAAIAIATLTYCPIRRENLASLRFGESLHISRGVAVMRIDAEFVKNKVPLEFDIPDLVDILLEYRDRFLPTIGNRFEPSIFVNVDGSPKTHSSISALVKRYTRKYLGVDINPHAFRHLAAKIILDRDPGAYPIVQQLLGHKSLSTTVNFYTARSTKRAGRHLRELLSRGQT